MGRLVGWMGSRQSTAKGCRGGTPARRCGCGREDHDGVVGTGSLLPRRLQQYRSGRPPGSIPAASSDHGVHGVRDEELQDATMVMQRTVSGETEKWKREKKRKGWRRLEREEEGEARVLMEQRGSFKEGNSEGGAGLVVDSDVGRVVSPPACRLYRTEKKSSRRWAGWVG